MLKFNDIIKHMKLINACMLSIIMKGNLNGTIYFEDT